MLAATADTAEAAVTTTPPDPGLVGITITVVLLVVGLAVWLVPMLITNARKMAG
jgi:hypothetical protein